MTTHQDESQTERELRAALADRAREIRPSSRLDAILDEASGPERASGRWPWAVPLSVAAAALLVAAVVWATRPETPSTLPAGPPTATTAVGTPTAAPSRSPSPGSSTSPSTSASPSPSGSITSGGGTTTMTALGVYRVDGNGGAQDREGLVRDFWTPAGGTPTDLDERATVAVRRSLSVTALWQGTDVAGVSVGRQRITVRLAAGGRTAPSEEAARLAVAAVVWTAQAAVGRGDVPVQVATPDGSPLLGRLPSGTELTRAGTPPEFLCDLWIDSPAPGASVRASQPVVVRGQAVAFEANVEWDLRRGTAIVEDGFTTASIGAPSRGAFSVDLGRLDAGTYTFRAFTTSAKDGSVFAERSVTFTVR